MQDLQVIELKGQRLLTTKQIAEAYGAGVEKIKMNYNNNKEKFIIGKHLIQLEGD